MFQLVAKMLDELRQPVRQRMNETVETEIPVEKKEHEEKRWRN